MIYQNYAIKRFSLNRYGFLLLLLLISAGNLWCQNLKFKTQGSIDSFSLNYPGLKEVRSIDISGEEITNLHGLSQLTQVERSISIFATSLENLKGLENIQIISDDQSFIGIIIKRNPLLTSLDALEDIRYKNPKTIIQIIENERLSVCNQSFICDRLQEFKLLIVYGNDIGCSTQEEVYDGCNINFDISNMEISHHFGFEEWNDTFPMGFLQWQGFYNDFEPNIRKVTSLTEGEFAVTLVNNIVLLECKIPTTIYTEIPSLDDPFNMQLDCQCQGRGRCQILLVESHPDEDEYVFRPIWELSPEDPSMYTLRFQNLEKSEGADNIEGIAFSAMEISYLHPGFAYFTIDNVRLYQETTNSINEEFSEPHIYPNPTAGRVNMKNLRDEMQFSLFEGTGSLLMKSSNISDINLTDLPSGTYLLRIKENKSLSTIQIIKH